MKIMFPKGTHPPVWPLIATFDTATQAFLKIDMLHYKDGEREHYNVLKSTFYMGNPNQPPPPPHDSKPEPPLG